MFWDGSPAEFREVITEFLFINDFFFLIFAGLYIAPQIRAVWNSYMTRDKRILTFKIFFAVSTHMTGLTMLRGWNMSVYWSQYEGHPEYAKWLDGTVYPIAALFVTALGLSCMIRIFTPRMCGNWGWTVALGTSIAVVGYLHWPLIALLWDHRII